MDDLVTTRDTARKQLSPELRLKIMRSIRSENTRPERLLLAAVRLAAPGLRIVSHARRFAGRPDLYIPSLRLAFFVDGCFFHGCSRHCRIPRNNREYWMTKIEGNVTRDRRVRRALRSEGISVWVFWEHSCHPKSLLHLARRISRIVKRVESRRDAEHSDRRDSRHPFFRHNS